MATKQSAKHVLVINDVAALLDVMRDLLEEEGYRVSVDTFAEADVKQLMQTMTQLAPDVVVLDLMIGNEALGWQLLQMIKLDRATATFPVVVCSAAVQQLQQLQAHLRAMNVAVVVKPFDIDALLTAIADALESAIDTAHDQP